MLHDAYSCGWQNEYILTTFGVVGNLCFVDNQKGGYMSGKTSPTTVRLTDVEQTFLSELKLPGATSVSDKIRMLIADRKRQDEAGRDYVSALALADSLLDPMKNAVRALENEHQMHSQLVRRVLELVPDVLASLFVDGVTPESDVQDLKLMEQRLSNQVLRVVDAVLQIYASRDSSLYQPELFGEERMELLQRMCKMILTDLNGNKD